MSTAIVRQGMRRNSNPGYGWAVPNYTYSASQYAPGPMPAPAWPRSSYSVFGRSTDYAGAGEFLAESAKFEVPNWALIVGGAYVLHKMKDGKKVPVRENPYGVIPFLIPVLAWGGVALGAKTLGGIGDVFSGASGGGLFLGMSLGILYAMKSKGSKASLGMGGALVGWGVGMAYEKAMTPDKDSGLVTKTFDFLL
jgi:hypothetical protein